MTDDTSPKRNIPEPLPISVDPAIDERARAFLGAVTSGDIDRLSLNDQLAALLSDTGFAAAAEHAAALGTPEGIFAFEQRITAEGVATYYRVRYPSQIWTWVFSVDRAGRINGFSLRRSPRYKIFDVRLRDVAY
ncbi:MAG TPA: hypothetical protein VFE16_10375 [Candidatus Cybelea sp.]|jgi:hypothetical protein|nr:hypothetical protein [Candidatus Cybelea sp.]